VVGRGFQSHPLFRPILLGAIPEITKKMGLRLLSLSGAFRVGRRLTRRSLLVVTYHRVLSGTPKCQRQRPPDTIFTWEFEEQIKYFVRHYHVVTGEEIRLFMTEHRKLPDYSVFITFDDGYENNYVEAFPILVKHGATAGFFLTTGLIGEGNTLWFDKLDCVCFRNDWTTVKNVLSRVGLPVGIQNRKTMREWIKKLPRPQRDEVIRLLEQHCRVANNVNSIAVTRLMTWDQVREMANAGMTIGSHTVSHQVLAGGTSEEIEEELVTSRLKIEKEIGRSCWCFAYPNGQNRDFRPSDKTALKSAGYVCAFTQVPGFITEKTDPYALPRISIPGSPDIRIFASRVAGVHHWLEGLAEFSRP